MSVDSDASARLGDRKEDTRLAGLRDLDGRSRSGAATAKSRLRLTARRWTTRCGSVRTHIFDALAHSSASGSSPTGNARG